MSTKNPKYYVIFDNIQETILSSVGSTAYVFSSSEEACIMAERAKLTDYMILKITGVCRMKHGTTFEKIS